MSGSERDRAESIRQRIRNRVRERGEDLHFGSLSPLILDISWRYNPSCCRKAEFLTVRYCASRVKVFDTNVAGPWV